MSIRLAEFDQLSREFDELNHRRKQAEFAERYRAGNIRLEPGTSRGEHDQFADERGDGSGLDRGLRSAAMRTLDSLVDGSRLPARAAETVENLTRTGSGLERSWTARVVEATGSDAYLRAFSKLVANPNQGHLLWDKAEHAAFQRVVELQSEMRAMSTVDNLRLHESAGAGPYDYAHQRGQQ
jgi:predicted phage gp36 major capsid-like protein